MNCTATVVADSINAWSGSRLTTLQLRYPRFIHAEAKTHRILANSGAIEEIYTPGIAFMDDTMLSRNASSSRAIPVAKMIQQVRNDPAMPIHWGKNQPGMQAREELTGDDLEHAKFLWCNAALDAADQAELMNELGLHKQVVNRILEPFQFISVIVTATEWDNFFQLRDHEDADPNIAALAHVMKVAMFNSTPVSREPGKGVDSLHLLYVTEDERHRFSSAVLPRISSARCARVSYLTHDGQAPDFDKDMTLYDRLVGSTPLHASPTEHPAEAVFKTGFIRNFKDGWKQHRVDVEQALAISA